jgi:hypothetical protein
MKLSYFRTATLFILLSLLFVSCEKKLQTEFGNSNIYFSNISPVMSFKGTETLKNISSQEDTTVLLVGIYRSGIVDNLQEVTVTLAVDSAYLQALIVTAQTALPSAMTDLMTKYKSSKAFGSSMFSIPATVVIPQGERKATVPVTIRKSRVKLYDNDYFNYSPADFANAKIIKNRMMLLPIKITATSELPIIEAKQRCTLQITKSLVIL